MLRCAAGVASAAGPRRHAGSAGASVRWAAIQAGGVRSSRGQSSSESPASEALFEVAAFGGIGDERERLAIRVRRLREPSEPPQHVGLRRRQQVIPRHLRMRAPASRSTPARAPGRSPCPRPPPRSAPRPASASRAAGPCRAPRSAASRYRRASSRARAARRSPPESDTAPPSAASAPRRAARVLRRSARDSSCVRS